MWRQRSSVELYDVNVGRDAAVVAINDFDAVMAAVLAQLEEFPYQRSYDEVEIGRDSSGCLPAVNARSFHFGHGTASMIPASQGDVDTKLVWPGSGMCRLGLSDLAS